jgi:predicted lipoprotein
MKQWFSAKMITWMVAGGLIIGVSVMFPPFKIVSLEENRNRLNTGVFDPLVFARQFWQNELPQALKNAADAQEVLNAIRNNPVQAKSRYGRVIGLGGPCYYFLKGSGTITAIDTRQIKVSLDRQDSNDEIILLTSMIFGNEVLDATNIISRNQFKKINDYNAISTEINQMVEKQITEPFLKQAKTGDTIHFIGCSTAITDEDSAFPMQLVPVKLEVE